MSILDRDTPNEAIPAQPAVLAGERPRYAAGASEDLLSGGRRLRYAFRVSPLHTVERGERLRGRERPEVMLLRTGFAFRSCTLADGRRAILDVLTATDMAGLDNVVVAHPVDEFIAASRVTFHALGAEDVRRMMTDPPVALYIYALLAEARWRANRLAVSIGRLDAEKRICLFLLDIYDRLHRQGLIIRPTYNLPLTQEQIADHLGLTVVHVNRTLRRLREEKLVIVDRQVVIIQDVARMRELIEGVPHAPEVFGERPFEGSAPGHSAQDQSAPTYTSPPPAKAVIQDNPPTLALGSRVRGNDA